MAICARKFSLRARVLASLLAGATAVNSGFSGAALADENFEDYEVRVIRPKYFQKGGRFELGAQFSAIMNETFVYTYMLSGIMTFHFNESFAIEGLGAYGFSINREEKELLKDQFEIRTQIVRTQYMLEGSLVWTPIYGKWQLPSGRLIYFDTFLSAGGGLNGVYWDFKDFCVPSKIPGSSPPAFAKLPANRTDSYPAFSFGGGQRYFINKSLAIKWDLRSHTIFYNTNDASCDPNAATAGGGESTDHSSVALQFGVSKFF